MLRIWILLLLGCGGKASLGDNCNWDGDCDTEYCAYKRCTTGQVGALCEHSECRDGLQCWKGLCRELGHEYVDCDTAYECGGAMECIAKRCIAPAHVEVETRRAAAAKEATLLAQSGVADPPPIEKVINPAGAGARVRIATATAADTVFAACRSDERLVGGSCKGASHKYSPFASYPSGQSADDTIGARWNCEGSLELTAFALCAKVPATGR